MSEVIWEVAVILGLIVLNGVFAMSEIAIVSARQLRLQQWADEGRRGAATALALVKKPERFLATVQIGITLIAILSGALGESTVGEALEESLAARGVAPSQAETWAVVLVVAAITFVSVVVGELLPKTAALAFRERGAVVVAPAMSLLARAAAPVVALLTLATRALTFLLRIRPASEPPVTDQDINALMQLGEREGVFLAAEQHLIGRVLQLDRYRVGALMRPRTEAAVLSLADDEATIRRKLTDGEPAYLVVAEDQTTVLGVAEAEELLRACLLAQAPDLAAVLHPVVHVPENVSALEAMQLLADRGLRSGLVVDEYGSIVGLITMNRLVQQIARDLPAQEEESRIFQRDDGSWTVDGLLPYQDLFEALGVSETPEEAGYHTVGGLAMEAIGRIPRVGDRFTWGPVEFEVVDMDGHRVDKLIVRITPPTPK